MTSASPIRLAVIDDYEVVVNGSSLTATQRGAQAGERHRGVHTLDLVEDLLLLAKNDERAAAADIACPTGMAAPRPAVTPQPSRQTCSGFASGLILASETSATTVYSLKVEQPM